MEPKRCPNDPREHPDQQAMKERIHDWATGIQAMLEREKSGSSASKPGHARHAERMTDFKRQCAELEAELDAIPDAIRASIRKQEEAAKRAAKHVFPKEMHGKLRNWMVTALETPKVASRIAFNFKDVPSPFWDGFLGVYEYEKHKPGDARKSSTFTLIGTPNPKADKERLKNEMGTEKDTLTNDILAAEEKRGACSKADLVITSVIMDDDVLVAYDQNGDIPTFMNWFRDPQSHKGTRRQQQCPEPATSSSSEDLSGSSGDERDSSDRPPRTYYEGSRGKKKTRKFHRKPFV